MAKKINRRKFLASLVLSGMSLYTAGWWFFKVRKRDATGFIIAIIRKKLSYLKIEKKELIAFARVHQARMPENWRYYASWAGIFRPIYAVADIFKFAPNSDEFRQFEEYTMMQFLLSSDFFIYDADESRSLKFREYYDLRELECENPFAKFE
ncbi:MAG: hypothetical protein GY839_15640 [candidate division Zixibacteria bacterium]|nr:hypothetical protein [candidate division Zixibacteria bacterium]